jgi:hypothetical protein
MDALISLVDQVIPGSPALAIVTAILLLAAGWIARRAARSMQRQGARVGTLERVTRLERSRRRQVEQTLREHGIRLPYWPDDPPELYLAGARLADDEDQDVDEDQDDDPRTSQVPTQYFTRDRLHRRTP